MSGRDPCRVRGGVDGLERDDREAGVGHGAPPGASQPEGEPPRAGPAEGGVTAGQHPVLPGAMEDDREPAGDWSVHGHRAVTGPAPGGGEGGGAQPGADRGEAGWRLACVQRAGAVKREAHVLARAGDGENRPRIVGHVWR